MHSSFPTLLRTARKDKGLSQQEVADHLKISRLTYIQMEKGDREPNLSELNLLADILDVPIGYLVGEQKQEVIRASVQKAEENSENTPRYMNQQPVSDFEKFKEVFLYILEKVGAKANIGETVLYKLLYFIDFDYYEKHWKSITGMTYIKNHHGPTPVQFKKYVDQLELAGFVEKIQSKYFTYTQKKYLPLKALELSHLSAQELRHIDDVLARLSDKGAKELSDYSHKDVPWIVHEPGQEISYQTVFYRSDDYSVAEPTDEL